MKIKVACTLSAAAFSFLVAPHAFADDDLKSAKTAVSLAGCIQRETDYRRQNDSGKGGFLGFGGGLGDEYVLVNASRGADGVFGDCTTATGGDAYELTGDGEEDLERFVGQRVAISGIQKEAELDPRTGRPTGGRQVGDDLRLFEVEVESFRALAAPVQVDTVARVQQEPTRFEPEQRPADSDRVEIVERNDTARQLPRTASPLALAGLLGLLSIGGAAAVRRFGRPRTF